jgi:hypothetical protein
MRRLILRGCDIWYFEPFVGNNVRLIKKAYYKPRKLQLSLGLCDRQFDVKEWRSIGRLTLGRLHSPAVISAQHPRGQGNGLSNLLKQ